MSDPFDVRYTAGLARLDLSEADIAKFQTQLSQVLNYVEALRAVDVANVEPTAHANEVTNVFREDVSRDAALSADSLKNAPRNANGLFGVPKVLE